uniref:Uncharacterized protein n=1 Tax=Anguilla anguilla TaxID=7936 RepID=A0A0E9UR89_ANGAN
MLCEASLFFPVHLVIQCSAPHSPCCFRLLL